MNKSVKKHFVATLRSDKFKQSLRGELGFRYRNGKEIHCAMGVLCELAVTNGAVKKNVLGGEHTEGLITYDSLAGFEPETVHRWAGMSDIEASTIRRLNDQQRKSFDEIADYVEENM